MQSTTSILCSAAFALLVALSCSSSQQAQSTTTAGTTSAATKTAQQGNASPEIDRKPLALVGKDIATLWGEGTLSVAGQQSMSGLAFTATIVGDDSCALTVQGPMGITAAKVWCNRTTYRAVNYLMREVYEGSIEDGKIIAALPIPIDIGQLFQLMRGMVPGKTDRFTSVSTRPSGQLLYSAKVPSDGGSEYALIDPVKNVLVQYQRKRPEGMSIIDVRYEDHTIVNSINVAHSVGISVDDKKSSAAFRFTNIRLNEPVMQRLTVDAPAGFKKVTN